MRRDLLEREDARETRGMWVIYLPRICQSTSLFVLLSCTSNRDSVKVIAYDIPGKIIRVLRALYYDVGWIFRIQHISPSVLSLIMLSYLHSLIFHLVRHHHSHVPLIVGVSNPYRRIRSQTARVTHDREILPKIYCSPGREVNTLPSIIFVRGCVARTHLSVIPPHRQRVTFRPSCDKTNHPPAQSRDS